MALFHYGRIHSDGVHYKCPFCYGNINGYTPNTLSTPAVATHICTMYDKPIFILNGYAYAAVGFYIWQEQHPRHMNER